jgi:hypothetical protein
MRDITFGEDELARLAAAPRRRHPRPKLVARFGAGCLTGVLSAVNWARTATG